MDDRIFRQLDRIENKLDVHLDRISRSEEAIAWLKSHVQGVTRIAVTIFLALGGLVAKLFMDGK
jgi:hypothetical protein